jgi:uncharacterized protein (DUF362 family)
MLAASPTVSVVKVTDLERDLQRLLAPLGGPARIARPGDRVLLKPNFGVPRPAESAVVTDPDVVFALARLFLDLGAKVAIGESCVTGFELDRVLEVLYVRERALDLGIDIVDLRRDRPVQIVVKDPLVIDHVRVARTALEADLIVNVPKMKTHVETTVTLATKNLKGVLTGQEKARFHQLDVPIEAALEAAVADLSSVLPPTFNVVDGILAMEGGGPLEGTPLSFGVLVAGDERVTVDAVCCDLMGIDPTSVRHLTLAAQRGPGTLDLAQIRLVGDPLEGLRQPFRLPNAMEFDVPAVELLEAGACSGCAGGIRQALRGMRDHPAAQKAEQRVRVYVGATVEGPSADCDLLVGNCAIRRLRQGVLVPGCPPLFGKMRLAMLQALVEEDEKGSVQDGDRRL